MIKLYCDICQGELKDTRFFCELQYREIKETLTGKEFKPQLVEKKIHLCRECFKEKLNMI